jgi:hypothetical protein
MMLPNMAAMIATGLIPVTHEDTQIGFGLALSGLTAAGPLVREV